MTQPSPTQLAQADYDPRQELIPRAPDVDAPDVGVESPEVGGSVSDFFSQLFGEFWAWLLTFGGLLGILSTLWSIYTFLAYLFCVICIVLYVYATIKLEYYSGLIAKQQRDEEERWNQVHRGQDRPSRLDDVYTHAASDNPNDWKLAIIEADIVLDQILKERGYVGQSLGERLRHITPSQLASIDDAWEAHKVRNRIAHEGADFVLTKRIVDETVARYRRVFTEFQVD